MNEQPIKEEFFNILRLLSSRDNLTQRDVSTHMNISLGKTNYLIKALIKRGFISVHNFSKHDGKINKVRYILTKRGLQERIHLTNLLLKKKEEDFNHIKEEWQLLVAKHLVEEETL